jgi:hypothetical protein
MTVFSKFNNLRDTAASLHAHSSMKGHRRITRVVFAPLQNSTQPARLY